MLNIQVPEALADYRQLNAGEFAFIHYSESSPGGRNLFNFSCCAVSFVLHGQKEFYGSTENTRVNNHEGIFIPAGNAVMAEHLLGAKHYSSLVIFFPAKMARDFINKRFPGSAVTGSPDPQSFFRFIQTPYMVQYIDGLLTLLERSIVVPRTLLQHKLEELFLVLADSLTKLFQPVGGADAQLLRQTVENNLLNNLTVTELAFLCNRSLASFKRDFEKAYGCSPGKYIREKKLDIARRELLNGQPPTALYLQMGYDNVSNFAGAFKKRFGQTPEAYLSQQKNELKEVFFELNSLV